MDATNSPAPTPHANELRGDSIHLLGGLAIAIGCAAPTVGIALTLGAMEAANSFAAPLVVLICAVPLLGIAWSYKRLNAADPDCGATYVWGAKAISPYFGFASGWIICLAYFVGGVGVLVPIGPYALQLFHNSYANSLTAQAIVGTAVLIFLGVIAYIGVRATARLQWTLIAIEYTGILILFVLALYSVFSGNTRSVPFDWNWFSLSNFGGTSGFIAGMLVSVYLFTGWESEILVNEETSNPRVTPGNALVLSVVALAIILPVYMFAFEGAVKPAVLQAHSGDILYYMGGTLGNVALAKWMILAVFLSAAGSTLSCIIAAARITFAMGYDHVFPPILARTDHRFRTPSVATIVAVLVTGGALWVYSLGSASIQGTFNATIGTAGLLFTLFYVVTGIAMPIYYRKLAAKSAKNFVELAVVPILSTIFLVWIGWKSIGTSLGGWTGEDMKYLYVMLLIGALILVYARLRHRAAYWSIRPTAFDPASEVADYADDGSDGARVTTP